MLKSLEGVSRKDRLLYENLETMDFKYPERDNLIIAEVLADLCKNKVADSILYTRISNKLNKVIDEEELDEQDDSLKDLEFVSDVLHTHSEEEFEFFQSTFSIAMALGCACDISFCEIPTASSVKFDSFEDACDFVQNREMTSLFKFYILLQTMISTPALADLSEEYQVEAVNMVKEIIAKELEHFEDLKMYSEVGTDERTQEKIQNIKDHLAKLTI